MPLFDQIMPKHKTAIKAPNKRVAILVYEGLCAFEFVCAAEVFALPRPEFGADWYTFETVGLTRQSVHGQYGQTIVANGGLERLVSAGTIIIPGWQGINASVPKKLIDALLKAHSCGARILTICSGAAVLAATGLLDGKRAATHWHYADALQAQYPRVEVDSNVLYVDEGQLLTSAGSAAGLDLCLHLVRRDCGPDIANHVARRLVISPHREGGQAQFIKQPIQKSERNVLSPLLDNMRRRLMEALTVKELANLAAMSERTFMRRFKEATAMTPIDWLTAARIDRACELLESSKHSIDHIAEQTGFNTATTLRHHFRKRLKLSPSDYRKKFRATK